jgi:hypothetical protein
MNGQEEQPEISSKINSYMKKRHRYYKLLDKKQKLAPSHLLDGSFAGTQQYCQLDESAEKDLNLKKARQEFRDAEDELIRFGRENGQYDLENEFEREVLISDILKKYHHTLH